jgi:hypothetical protein
MVVFASLVVGFCSGFLSLFGGALCELLGKKGKPTKGVAQTASSAGFPSSLLPYITGKATAAVLWSPWVSTSVT